MIDIQLRKAFENEIKKPPSGRRYVFLTDNEFYAESLFGDKYFPIHISKNSEPNSFTVEEFINYITESRNKGVLSTDRFYYLPINSPSRNKELQSALKDNYFEFSDEVWKVFSCKSKNIDYFKQNLGELKKIVEEFVCNCEGMTKDDKQGIEIDTFFGEKGRFLHNVFGDYIMSNYDIARINGKLHIYDNGIYTSDDTKIYKVMLEIMPELTLQKRKEVYSYVEIQCVKIKELSPPNFIPFKSQIYDLKSETFIDYSPEYVFLNKLMFDYNINVPEYQSISSLVEQIADYDKDVVKLLYETIGYCFYRACPYRGAVILYGASGNNGKSTLLNLISRLLGSGNISNLSLQDTADKFRLAELYGKLANIGDDIPARYIEDSSLFKKLVTGEPIVAEMKYKNPFQLCNYAKLFFASNELPRVSDKTKAFISRVLVIPLNHDFKKDANYNPSLKDRFWSDGELEYLMKLAMDGLKRIVANRGFTIPKAVNSALLEYEEMNNPIISFLDEYGDIQGMPTGELYGSYKRWCDESGYKEVNKNTFSKEVCQIVGVGAVPKRIDGTVQRVYVKPLDVYEGAI